MAASLNVPQSLISGKSPIPKSGVLTLSGFGVSVKIHNGHLHIEDGVGLKRRTLKLPRVNHGLKRLVCISEDGFATLSALKWLADVGASFVLLNRSGKVVFVTGPAASSDARLHRAQALAFGNAVGLEICRRLIDAKLEGQERLMRERLNDGATAEVIWKFRDRLPAADTIGAVRSLEASAAFSYFGAWREIPVFWPRADVQRIPQHWLTVGTRQSPLSGGPRLAITPVHAILNYSFALLEAETRLALLTLGLDPALGVGLHSDTPHRDSLALDVLEPVRPQVEMWLLDWITREPLRRADFYETPTGNCRLMSQLCAKLGQTAPVWRKLVAPWAEYVTRALSAAASQSKSILSSNPPTRLTQQRRREAKGKLWLSTVEPPEPERLCRGCGKTIRAGRTHCANCAVSDATERLVNAARLGRVAARRPEARAKHIVSRRRHAQACSEWDSSKQPAWLTSEVFSQRIQPLLVNTPTSAIRSQIAVSRWYAGRIRHGYRPHPRHWQALAYLVGISSDLQIQAV